MGRRRKRVHSRTTRPARRSRGLARVRRWFAVIASQRRRAAALVSFLLVVLGFVANVGGASDFAARHLLRHPPPPMSGDLNVAVAEFSAVSSSASGDAKRLAESMFDRVQAQLAEVESSGFDVQVRSPRDTGKLSATASEPRAEQLRALARKARADIVVAGSLAAGTEQTTFTPEFFLAEGKLQDAEELGGYHQLGSVVEFGTPEKNPVARRALRERLLRQTRGVVSFIIGLGYYNHRNYPAAAREFVLARQEWSDQAGKALVSLFLGNTAGKRADLGLAERYYREALGFDPGAPRARLGLAELVYQRARGACGRRTVDAAGLQRAASLYRDALPPSKRVSGVGSSTKAAFGLGRVYLCLSQAEVANRWTEAEGRFLEVVRAFGSGDRGNQRLRELASEAYANLGLIYLPSRGEAHAERAYGRAADAYKTAIGLSLDGHRQGVFHGMLAYVHGKLDEVGDACAEYERAAALDPDNAGQYRTARSKLGRCS